GTTRPVPTVRKIRVGTVCVGVASLNVFLGEIPPGQPGMGDEDQNGRRDGEHDGVPPSDALHNTKRVVVAEWRDPSQRLRGRPEQGYEVRQVREEGDAQGSAECPRAGGGERRNRKRQRSDEQRER